MSKLFFAKVETNEQCLRYFSIRIYANNQLIERLRIALFINPAGNKPKCRRIGKLLTKKLGAHRIDHVVFDKVWPQNLDGLAEAWIVGGDGTINYFINQYKNPGVPLVLFKGGTGNDLAWKLYGNMSLEKQFNTVLGASPTPIDVIRCNDRLFINSMGVGFDGEILKFIKMIRFLGGHLGYLLAVIAKIFTFKEAKYIITADDLVFEGKLLLLAVNNNSRTGGGFMITPHASLDDGKIDLLLCEPLTIIKRLRVLPRAEKGNHLHYPFIHYEQVTTVKIECEKETAAHLDGELISDKIFDISLLPGYVSFKF
jgi:diacylglycerol kinase (ATP)